MAPFAGFIIDPNRSSVRRLHSDAEAQYGLIFSACSAAVMSGALLDGRLGRRGISAALVLTIGLALLAAAGVTLLAVAGWTQPALIAALLMAVALAFGMTMPNIMNATTQPLPDIAVVSAAAGSIQMTAGAASSGLVAVLFDGRSALSMAGVTATCSLLALISYCLLGRLAERRRPNSQGRSKAPRIRRLAARSIQSTSRDS